MYDMTLVVAKDTNSTLPIAERLRAIRNRTGMGMDRFAKLIGLPGGSSLQRYEDPTIARTHLPVDLVQKLLKVVGIGEPPITRHEIMALAVPVIEEILPPIGGPADRYRPSELQVPPSTVPVYAAAMGGAGHLLVAFDPIDYRAPPAEISTVRDAYGILVVGESMVPAFDPGDTAWINPHLPPQFDTDVVLYHTAPAGKAEAIIKRLVSFTSDQWTIRQYNDFKTWPVSRADWHVCHRIVGKKSRSA
jgi:hypothetical protein